MLLTVYCNQSERDAIFGRDSYERKLSNHHDQGRRQGGHSDNRIFLRNAHVKKIEGPGAPVFVEGAACATAQWHNGQSKPGDFKAFRHGYLPIVLHVPLTMQHLKLPLELIEVQRITLFSPHNPSRYTIISDDRVSLYFILPIDTDHYLIFKEIP